MGIGDNVHIFTTSDCNLNCSYCFGPEEKYKNSRLVEIAGLLAQSDVTHVILGGGEPLLADIYKPLEILKNAGVYTEIHTNGTKLTNRRISALKGLVDCMGLPLDTLDEKTQVALRRGRFRKTFRRIFEIADQIRAEGIEVGWHTVFTAHNHNNIPEMYEKLNYSPFKYWRIYEFNYDLARAKVMRDIAEKRMEDERLIEKIVDFESLAMRGTPGKGLTDCLAAKFLLADHDMQRHEDPRVQFVGLHDFKQPYLFIEPDGNARFYTWFSQYERRKVGNIFKDGFDFIRQKLGEVSKKGMDFIPEMQDEFVETQILDAAAWQIWDTGMVAWEDIEQIDEEYWDDFVELAILNQIRKARVEGEDVHEMLSRLPLESYDGKAWPEGYIEEHGL